MEILQKERANLTDANPETKFQDGLDEDVDIDKLERIIGFLFNRLDDKSTDVRWSAAKGIGRITGRLDLDLANDILDATVDTFQNKTDCAWHGGLLCLGELARRG